MDNESRRRMPTSGRSGARRNLVDSTGQRGRDRARSRRAGFRRQPRRRDVDRGDEIVVCGGTYGSPALLLRTGIGSADELRRLGIPVVADLPGVGSNLSDHPAVEVEVGWSGTGTSTNGLHSIANWRSSQARPDKSPDMLFWLADPVGEAAAFTIECVLMRPEGRGRNAPFCRPADRPRIRLPALSVPADLERLGAAAHRARDAAMHPAVRAICDAAPPTLPEEPAALDTWVRENAYSVPHVVGTCAMGVSPADGAVVDPDGRVHGVERLRVVDASILPEPPSGFPNLITMMVAERIASTL